MAEDLAPHGELRDGPGTRAAEAPKESETSGKKKPAQGPEPDAPRPKLAGRLASLLILLLAALAIALVLSQTNRNPRTDDAEVFANYIGMAPVVNGPITEIDVRDNQPVHAGDILFRIDDRPYRYALERARSDRSALEGQIEDEARRIRGQRSAAVAAAAGTRSAEANVGGAAAAVDEAGADVTNAQAALARAKAEYNYSVNNLKRVEPLLVKQFVTPDQVDQLRTGTAAKELAVQQAESQVRLAGARLQSSLASLAASRSGVSQSQAQQRESQNVVTTLAPYTAQRGARDSAIENAEYNLNHCVVHAPFDARVTNLTLSEGAFAHAGEQVFTLIDTRTWWVVANFRETQLRRILPGMPVEVYLMSEPGHLYRGVVDSASFGVTPDAATIGRINPAGLPDVQRTLSWVHLASRYPVRIRILDPAPNQFRIAESAVVVVRGGHGW